jgi:hypothetical protein
MAPSISIRSLRGMTEVQRSGNHLSSEKPKTKADIAKPPVDWVLPQFGVRDRRQMFNRAAAGSIWVTAASCAVVGASMVGGAGAIVGGLLGLLLADHVFRNYRFIR